MKHVFVSFVMICSLLLAICGCSNDFTPQLEPNLEVPEKPGIIQKKPGENMPNSLYEEESDDPEDLDLEDIDQEEEDEDNIDYPETDQKEADYPRPKLSDFYLFSNKEIRINFSETVKIVSCTFTQHQEIERIQDGKTVIIYLKENLELKTKCLIELNVKDDRDNSLSFEVPLFANYWIPEIEINELRTEYSGTALQTEYVEFKVKSTGNLDGLRLFIMWDPKKPYIFDLPAVDVKSNEYITLHMRTLDSICINELGEDLSESPGKDSSPTARDLWVPDNKTKWLHKTDIVYLQDANGRILDAIVMNEKPGETWDKNRAHFAKITEDLYNKGAWKSIDGKLPGPLDAVDTSKIATTKTINRYEGKENTHTAKDWYITNTKDATPGLPNK